MVQAVTEHSAAHAPPSAETSCHSDVSAVLVHVSAPRKGTYRQVPAADTELAHRAAGGKQAGAGGEADAGGTVLRSTGTKAAAALHREHHHGEEGLANGHDPELAEQATGGQSARPREHDGGSEVGAACCSHGAASPGLPGSRPARAGSTGGTSGEEEQLLLGRTHSQNAAAALRKVRGRGETGRAGLRGGVPACGRLPSNGAWAHRGGRVGGPVVVPR